METQDPRADERREAVRRLLQEMGETRFRAELQKSGAGIIGKHRAKYADELVAELDTQRRDQDPSVQQGWIALHQGKLAIGISIVSLVVSILALIRAW